MLELSRKNRERSVENNFREGDVEDMLIPIVMKGLHRYSHRWKIDAILLHKWDEKLY